MSASVFRFVVTWIVLLVWSRRLRFCSHARRLIGYRALKIPLTDDCIQAAKHPPLLSRSERETLFARCFARLRSFDSATGWFYFANPSGIKSENIVEWLLWALFNTHRDGLEAEWEEELEQYIAMIEKLMDRKLEHGWDDTIQCMKVSLDPVVMLHRPLIWYAVSDASI